MLHALAVITLSSTLSQITNPSTPLQKWQGVQFSAPSAVAQFVLDEPKPNDAKPQESESPKPPNEQFDSQNPTPGPASQGESSSNRQLPDKPIPKDIIPREGCPDVDGAPCGNYGGFRFFRNTTFTEHDRTWGQAMSHPLMWGVAVALVASTVLDIEGTAHCLKLQVCTERNPIFGKHPSRARMYGTAMPLAALGIYSLGRMKMMGHGFGGFLLAFTGIGVHTHFGLKGFYVDHPRSTK